MNTPNINYTPTGNDMMLFKLHSWIKAYFILFLILNAILNYSREILMEEQTTTVE